uniref:Uncharacterized protein n=1 Tax=Arundo donax TaxID=35708 RepID=A0A0A9B4S9_ARUDO
MSYTMHVM